MLGLAVGAVASGALVRFGPWPRDLIYLVAAALRSAAGTHPRQPNESAMITFLAGMLGIIAAIAAGALVLLIAATIVAGAGQGSLQQIAFGCGGLAFVAALFTVIAARNPRSDTPGTSRHGEES